MKKNNEKKPESHQANRLYDRLYLYSEYLAKVLVAHLDDFKLESTEAFAIWAGRFVNGLSTFLAWLVDNDKSKPSFLLILFIKFFFIFPLFLVIVLPIILLILVGGTIASIFGLRNIGEYSLSEQIAAWCLFILIVLIAPLFCSEYSLYTINLSMAYGLGILGLDFLLGQCGIISLGQGGFLLSGSFAVMWLSNGALGFHLPIYISIVLGALLNGLIGILLGIPALRVRDHYLVIVSIAFSFSISAVLRSKYFVELTGSRVGGLFLPAVKTPEFLASVPPYILKYFLLMIPSVVLFFFAYNIIHHSQIGRAFRTIKCDDEVTMILGIPVVRYKLLAFSLSAIYAGFAGGFILVLTNYLSVDSYSPYTSIDLLVANVIGGSGGVFGSIVGGIFLAMEPNFIHFVAEHIPNGKSLTHAVYGVVLILVILFAPLGIVGEISKLIKSKFRKNPRRGSFNMVPPPDFDYLESRKQYFPKK